MAYSACRPADSRSALFEGYAAGPHWSQAGDGSNYLCLPEEPQWKTYLEGNHAYSATGYMHGVQYGLWSDATYRNSIFDSSNSGGVDLLEQAAPCAVCYAGGRSTTLMIPARTECPDGWTAEYSGYLMSESHGSTHGERRRSSYLCWDEAPEIAADGAANSDQSVIYPVEVQCGTLSCSKYVTGRELACMVCSK